VVFQTYHEINYHGNSRAKNGESWYFEADSGENRNGFNYYGSIVLGYQMPIFLSMVAFMAEMDLNFYDTPGRTLWGDDLMRWHFANVLQFRITEKLGAAIITQFRTMRNFTNFDLNEAKKADAPMMHYQNRILNTSNPLRLEFYRVAGILSYSF
jgi:hypothetical protein